MAQPDKPTAGLLQIPGSATQKSPAPARKAHKPPAPRLKLIIRRLPPGLTQSELEGALGAEWKVGAGKVDWLQYKAGKVSKDPAKPSRPSRAYIHVVSSEHVTLLSDQVRQASFQDARATSNDPILLGPPSLEFAPYAKIPGSRVRKDARQGTIDQDQDFIAFLESLTQPITKSVGLDHDSEDKKKEAVLTTPLVQFIKDKKASKAKEAATAKSSKHGRSEKEPKEKVQAKKLLQRTDKENSAPLTEKRTRGDKAKESTKAAKQGATGKSGKASTSATPKEVTAAPERKRERGNVTAATKILQRDLGISPAGGRRRGKGANDTGSSKNESSRDSSAPAEATKKEPAAKPAKNAQSKAKKDTDSTTKATDPPASSSPAPTKATKGPKPKPSAPPASTATQAFLKHANPSQGVTEALLETAFGVFGAVNKVEIDKKKGFGYVDFADPGGLQKAMAASPVTVAQSQVVVLERKANPGGEKSRKGRGDSQQAPPSGNTEKTGNTANAGNAASAGNATGSSARGSRGGRGSRNKAKGGAGGNEKTEKTEKTEKGGSSGK
ncbi:hypothetical protein N7520_003084 [Penicillium odoratum]|uniref:uncharacterized protein n=1 Tax=Penicillium odoratum TaxID=1167516 RepID=UPI0025498A65|nr:uncharacterized protein N7520_003084 [Penicillium odoratum]KAJ5772555.1 hypothetical protein N7520_003084 [Penicillium odoratum]